MIAIESLCTNMKNHDFGREAKMTFDEAEVNVIRKAFERNTPIPVMIAEKDFEDPARVTYLCPTCKRKVGYRVGCRRALPHYCPNSNCGQHLIRAKEEANENPEEKILDLYE